MGPKEALEASQQYGIVAVVLILVLFFMAYLIIRILKASERREERLAMIIEGTLHKNEVNMMERHKENTEAFKRMEESSRRQREEHEKMLSNQSLATQEHGKIVGLLDILIKKMELS